MSAHCQRARCSAEPGDQTDIGKQHAFFHVSTIGRACQRRGRPEGLRHVQTVVLLDMTCPQTGAKN
jgi:hypothetical protein